MAEEVVPCASVLSQRGARTAGYRDFLYDMLVEVMKNPYHPEKNPEGTVNLGTAVNCLMEEEVCERLNQGDALFFKPHYLHYYNFSGTPELKEGVADFLNRHFKPLKPIMPDKMTAMGGATGCLNGLAHALCDSGDVAITPTPVYSRIQTDFLDVANVKVEPLDLVDEEDAESTTFSLHPEALECRIKDLRALGRRVRAFILLNPQNPLGEVYSPALLTRLLDVCARNEVHVIVDEVYALSVHDEGVEFRSVLTVDLPDPERTHVIWALSKDLGLAGLRVGVILSHCTAVHEYFHNVCIFGPIPYVIQQAAATLLNDTTWCEEVYLPTNRKRLAHNYRLTCDRLERMGARVRRASAGLFVWFSVKPFLRHPPTWEEESALQRDLLDAGLYIVQGKTLYCASPGWMRLVFAVTAAELHEGLNRLETILTAWREKLAVMEP